MCFVFSLDSAQSKIFLAYAQRAFSPQKPFDAFCQDLLDEYHEKNIDYSNVAKIQEHLYQIDERLMDAGFNPIFSD